MIGSTALKMGNKSDPLTIPKSSLGKDSAIPVEILPDDHALITRFADDLLSEYLSAKRVGRDKVVFIVPVGPVGQYDLWADRCNKEGINLQDLVVINMDEYLTPDCRDFIPLSDPLSFRRHMDDHFYDRLDPRLAPPPEQRLFPHPMDFSKVPRTLGSLGGCDVCFGGIGITGHVAFNDPPEPGEKMTCAEFSTLPTRVVRLSRETRLINSVTTSRGNIDRIPEFAVTVGMKEILASRKVRIYMNRFWQSAIVRKILYGPVTPAVPASLLKSHFDVRFVIADYVAELPEPELL
jgi:glucosamine-6-phosphate deaminase